MKNYLSPVFLSGIIQKDLKAPQSYCSLERDKPWSEAVSIAAMIQCQVGSNEIYSII